MATGQLNIRHVFGGGWQTDFGPTATSVTPNDAGILALPYLYEAENVLFEEDGGPHKIPGTDKLNSSVVESGATIRGLYDFWHSGTSGTSTQKRIIHANTKILKDDADGAFDDLFTGLQSDSIPSYTVLEDILVIAQTGTDVPKSWDTSTAQNLAGSPPNFSICTTHRNRVWASGVIANPSRLYYSALLDPEDWTGAGSGSIDIDPDDGDVITAIVSFNNELIVFKGPYKGSIHRITGSSPTGDDGFARLPFKKGIGAVNHNCVVEFRNDLGFLWSDGTYRSLANTDRFGDLAEASLTSGINIEYIDKRVAFSSLTKAWAAKDETRGLIALMIPVDSSTDNNQTIFIDYRFNPIRLSSGPAVAGSCVASVVDSSSSNRRILMIGGTDGYVRRWGQETRSADGSAIASRVLTPYVSYTDPIVLKTMARVGIEINPKNDSDITVRWQRDGKNSQEVMLSQGGVGDVLGPASENQFVLDSSSLGGGRLVNRYADAIQATESGGGEFRSVRYEIVHNVVGADLEVHSISAGVERGALSTEDI